AGLTPAVEDVAGAVAIHVLGLEVADVVLVQVPAAHAVVALRALIALDRQCAVGARVALRALRTQAPVGTGSTCIALRALPALRAGVAVGTLRTGVTHVALGALLALDTGLTPAVEDVAGAVAIHVLGLEVADVVLVQVPAAHTVVALRALIA